MKEDAPDKSTATTDEASSLAAINARLTSLEDHNEILNLLAALPHSSDVGDQDFQSHVYHDDCIMDRDNANDLVVGKAAIVDIIGSERHTQAIQAGMVHFAGLPNIHIDDTRAVATGYLQIVVPIAAENGSQLSGYGPSDGLAIWRVTANRWELEKDGGRWKVTRRIIRSVPCDGFHDLIAEGLK